MPRKPHDNIQGIDSAYLDEPIYRIFSFKYFQELFTKKELVLLNPSKWDDPFENFFLQTNVEFPDGTLASLKSQYDDWYGQCWTTQADSDAMWRIYSQKNAITGIHDGIRISTTVRKLFDAIWNTADRQSFLKFFIGKVEYSTEDKIIAFLLSTSFTQIMNGGTNDLFAKLLMIKRTEFEHENEVRIIVNDVQKNVGDHVLYKITIDPATLFDEVCIDPRLKVLEFRKMKSDIQAMGIKQPIIQSQLYTMNLPNIKM